MRASDFIAAYKIGHAIRLARRLTYLIATSWSGIINMIIETADAAREAGAYAQACMDFIMAAITPSGVKFVMTILG